MEAQAANPEQGAEHSAAEAAASLNSPPRRLPAFRLSYMRMISRLRRLLRGEKTNPLFDRDWYLSQYPDVRDGAIDPYDHFLRYGAAEGRDPSPAFDTQWYLKQNADVRESGINPLVHFYRHGAAEGRDPRPPLSQVPNIDRQPDEQCFEPAERPSVPAERLLAPAERPSPTVTKKEEHRCNPADIAEEFDTEFYLYKNPDVAAAKINPLEHFILNGWKEGRDPAQWFSTRYYLKANRDVAAANINPFWHYVVSGRKEGRSPKAKLNDRQLLLERLKLPEETESRNSVPVHDRLTEARLLERFRTATHNAGGLALSFSHRCYLTTTGGTELFIADEQKLFNAQNFAYVHLSPLVPSIFIKDSLPAESLTRIAIDGEVIGVATLSALARVLKGSGRTLPDNRILIVHSIMGQSNSGFLHIFAVFNPTDTYYWLHDYLSVCSGYNLLRNHIHFCHAPPQDSMACRVCIFGASRQDNGRHLLEMFAAANFTVVAPSVAAQKIWEEASDLPRRAVVVLEHCRLDYSAGVHRDHRLAERTGLPGHSVKVAFVGYPMAHKGWPVFERLVEEVRGDSAYEFFHFAEASVVFRSRLIRPIEAVVTSDRRDAMVELLREHEIDLVVVPAPWPETFSYVTFESFAAGCDVITLADSGNVAASVERTGRGRVFENEDQLVEFFVRHGAVELVRSRAEQPNACGALLHCGTTAAIVFDTAH